MDRTLSLYLDLVRALAAFTVFLVHASARRFTDGWLWRVEHLGNDAVIVFFVLSGFVIAYVSQTRETSFVDFAVSRLARLWSVVIPALVLTVSLDAIGRSVYPLVYEGSHYRDSEPVWRFVANLFFVNELWFMQVHPFSNSPFWSIGYEFWYYALFAAAAFARGWTRLALCCVVAAIAGPKILLLLPAWCTGVLVHAFVTKRRMAQAAGWALFVGSIVAYLMLRQADVPARLLALTIDWLGESFVKQQLVYSKEFLASYLVAACVACNFIGFSAIAAQAEKLFAHLAAPIRFVAGYTFSMYLFHAPLLHFFSAVLRNDATNRMTQLLAITLALAAVFALGSVTEKKKHLWRAWLHHGANLTRAR